MRSKTILFAIALALAWASAAAGDAATPCYVGTYADPMHIDVNTFTSGSFFMVDVWVWVKPSDVGLKAVEFMLGYPSGAFLAETHTNPDIPIWLGDLNSGISAAFGPCQTDWVWTHRQIYYVFSTGTKGYFSVLPHPMVGAMQYASCEDGHPIYPLTVVNNLALNQCAFICGCWPRIETVEPRNYVKLRVDFGACVNPLGDPYTDHFHLFAAGSAVEALDIAASERISEGVFDLTLAAPMTEGLTYVLVAQEMPSCEEGCPWVESSSRAFLFDGQIATLLQTQNVAVVDGSIELAWTLSAIEPEARFAVSRSANGGTFVALDGVPSETAPLEFRFVDATVAPGNEYVYVVEYSAGDGKRILFTSESVAVPAARLALHQNVPNPFNPSTTISFTLPEAAAVDLGVYDVSGHLVVRLVDGERLGAGTHRVEWDGRDGAGRSVASGMYFSRLAVGKDRLVRKMVLLK